MNFIGAGGNLYLYYNLYKFCAYLNENQDRKVHFKAKFQNLDDVSFSQFFDQKKYLKHAEDCYYALLELIVDEDKTQKIKSKPIISFYFGVVGIYTVGAFLFRELNDKKSFCFCVEQILDFKKIIIKSHHSLFYDELLYGVSGYLYCLLALQKEFQAENLISDFKINLDNCVYDIVQELIERGLKNYDKELTLEKLSKNVKLPEDFHLIYTFHEKPYIGGAHGYFGVINILYTAYNFNKNYFDTFHKDFTILFHQVTSLSLSYYLKLQFASGNFPPSFSRLKKDELVQFCHGSPGVISPLILALRVHSNDEKLVENIKKSLLKACDNIWNFGLLKKGFGICHGISGNGYGFLNYYNYTSDMKYLYMGLKFALAKNDKQIMNVIENFEFEDRYIKGKSDNPYSLMMGLSGDILFILHLFFPELTKFIIYLIYFLKRKKKKIFF